MYETKLSKFLPGDFITEMSQQFLNELIDNVASQARAIWINQAQNKLHGTLDSYVKGIQQIETVPSPKGTAIRKLELTGTLPLAIENGQKAYDMHDTLLGPNVPVVARGKGLKGKHLKKDGTGYYRTIPFRHTNPGSASLLAPALGRAYEQKLGPAEAKALGKSIYRQAKKLTESTGMPGQKITWGSRLEAGFAPKLKRHHKTDIYAGMVKESKFYQQISQSQYATFRTISTGSPGWHRKATPGVHLLREVKKIVEAQVIRQTFEDMLEELQG